MRYVSHLPTVISIDAIVRMLGEVVVAAVWSQIADEVF